MCVRDFHLRTTDMKIIDVRTHVLEAPLSQSLGHSFGTSTTRSACLVEIETDNGLIGWGECLGPAGINAATVRAFGAYLVGADPCATEAIWQTLYNQFRDRGQKGIIVAALSGVDIALWDIRGKAHGVPIYRLMGGPLRTRVQAYASGGFRLDHGDPFDYIVREVKDYAAQGFPGIKIKVGRDVREDAELVKAVRKAIGPSRKLMIDANHGYDALEAIALGRQVADQNIEWFEEPVVPEDLASYREVKMAQPIPVAGGECEYTRWGFLNILTSRSLDILQPDTCAAGGLSECKKIADMANAFGVRYVPHVWGTGIGLAAALHLLAVLPDNPPRINPCEPLLEFDRTEHPFRQAILAQPLEHENGWVPIPSGPGLGIEINPDTIRKFSST
ncbi:D-galactarolactone cycloisomerase [Bradyrhizobium sp. LA6.10]